MKDVPIKPRVIVIVGPTAIGKTALSIVLAKKLKTEIISADSRQVYKGLDIGTGKVTTEEMADIKHHMLDIVSPQKTFTVFDYQKQAQEIIKKLLKENKIPIICGGTGFYIDSILYNTDLPKVKINKKLRKELSKHTAKKLYEILLKKDPKRAKEIDPNNKVRLIRSLEIIEELGYVPKNTKKQIYNHTIIGLNTDIRKLEENIKKRLLYRIENGMIEEVQNLHANGLSWKRLHSLGLEYRHIAEYLQNKITKEQMIELLNIKIRQYAKRQLTWFKRNKDIVWFEPSDIKSIEIFVEEFCGR